MTISKDVQKLTGEGVEYLTDSSGNPLAKFVDGMLAGCGPVEDV